MIQFRRGNLETAKKPMIKNVEIKANTNAKTRFDGQLQSLKKEKNDKYIKYSKEKSQNNWDDYVEARNTYNKLIKSKKDTSIRNELKKSNKNQKSMWKSLNKMLPKKKNQTTSCEIKFENGATSNENEIRNNFKDFFRQYTKNKRTNPK